MPRSDYESQEVCRETSPRRPYVYTPSSASARQPCLCCPLWTGGRTPRQARPQTVLSSAGDRPAPPPPALHVITQVTQSQRHPIRPAGPYPIGEGTHETRMVRENPRPAEPPFDGLPRRQVRPNAFADEWSEHRAFPSLFRAAGTTTEPSRTDSGTLAFFTWNESRKCAELSLSQPK